MAAIERPFQHLKSRPRPLLQKTCRSWDERDLNGYSKKYYGTSHMISQEEAEFIYERGSRQLIIGTGQYDNVRLSPEAAAYLAKKGCEVIARPTPEALAAYNESSESEKIALFHVTC